MTRKDFELIARAIRPRTQHNAVDPIYAEGWHAGVSAVARALAYELKRDNPRFDEDRFFKACNV